MKLQLLTALSAVTICACSSSAGEDDWTSVDAGAQASADGALDTMTSEDAANAKDGVGQADALDTIDAADTSVADPSLLSFEQACLLLHGCLGIDGVRQCLLYAKANAEASEQELRFGVAMQSIVMQGSPAPGPAATLYLPSILDCVGNASDCDAVRACVGEGSPCDPNLFEPLCEGDTLHYCVPTAEGGVIAKTPCAGVGLRCLSSSAPMGSIAQCAEGACDMGTAPVCEQGTAKNCILGGWIHHPCATMPGTQCAITDAMGMDMAQCQGDGADCDISHVPTCVGDDLSICQGNKLYTMACPPGGGCVEDSESGAGGCWGSTLFCGAEECDGTSVVYCVDGQERSVDCTERGFSGCAAAEGGARCTS